MSNKGDQKQTESGYPNAEQFKKVAMLFEGDGIILRIPKKVVKKMKGTYVIKLPTD